MDQRHDLGLAAAGRHFYGVTGEVIELQKSNIATRCEGFDEGFVAANLCGLVEINKGLDRFTLEIVIDKTWARHVAGGRS